MDWYTCSKTFIKVIQEKSFAKAATKLFTNQSVVSKRVNWLESQLDTLLLTRTTRRLDLTEAGENYYNHILPLIEEWDKIKENTKQTSKIATGTLRVAIPLIAGNHDITLMVARFIKKYPQMKVTMLLRNIFSNLLETKIDVSIGGEQKAQMGVNQLPLSDGYFRRLYASPDYLDEYGEPKSLDDLKDHTCLTNSVQEDEWSFQEDSIAISGSFKSNSSDMLITAAVAGMGIIYTPEYFVKSQLEDNRLKPILTDYHSLQLPIYAYIPSGQYIPMKTQLFIDFLKEELKNIH